MKQATLDPAGHSLSVRVGVTSEIRQRLGSKAALQLERSMHTLVRGWGQRRVTTFVTHFLFPVVPWNFSEIFSCVSETDSNYSLPIFGEPSHVTAWNAK